MSSHFVVAGQWQGSGSSRAMRLIEGAEAIRHELPGAATTTIEVPLEAGDAEGTGILRYSSIRLVRERLQRRLAELDGATVIIGGDCGVAYAGVEHAARAGRVVLLWADAHGDLNTPASSPSGAFGGMVLRSIIDAGIVAPADVILVGVRDLDDAEAEFIAAEGLRRVVASDVSSVVAERAAAARDDHAEPVLYAHVDLDVLDPAVFSGVGFAVPFGLELAELTGAIAAARDVLPLVGAGVAGFAPTEPVLDSAVDNNSVSSTSDDVSVILRILATLKG